MIGIVGGIGPMAGVDLYRQIVENTNARTDQEHLPVLLASLPNEITDRTSFLLGKTVQNPASALARVIMLLNNAGCSHVGIACNTAHAPQIFEPMQELLGVMGARVELVHMIEEVIRAILDHPDQPRQIGILSTTGTYTTRIYQNRLEAEGLIPVMLDYPTHEALVQRAIYEIKAASTQIPPSPIKLINEAIVLLKNQGAEALVLGCTEIGMVADQLEMLELPGFNPNLILARTLIERTFPMKLKRG
ncbi:MAG: aspartate/glutamate racemase family protein [Saprospiraceae bacterium]|nr:aspartate/glutamate racemase family protein [Saprospiraceae bacterium]